MSTPASIHAFLGKARSPYTVVLHRTAFAAQEEAAAMHVPRRDWAKVVICVADEKPIQVVLPAPLIVNLDRLLALAGANSIQLALEEELRALFPIVSLARCRRLVHCTDSGCSLTPRWRRSPKSSSTRARTARRFGCGTRTLRLRQRRRSAGAHLALQPFCY
jgi:Aminoacyl-tRNA editing domain